MVRIYHRYGIVIVLLHVAFTSSAAQMRIGVHSGMNESHYTASGSEYSYSPRRGLVIGGDVEFHLAANLWMLSGVEYIENGSDITLLTLPGTATLLYREELYREDYRYVEIPVGCKYRFLRGFVHPTVGLGVKASFLNSAAKYWRLAGGGYSMDDATPYSNRVVLLAYGSGGVEYVLNHKTAFSLEIAYNAGLTPVTIWSGGYANNITVAGGVQLVVND